MMNRPPAPLADSILSLVPWAKVEDVLALAAGEQTLAIAAQMQCEETTVWRAS